MITILDETQPREDDSYLFLHDLLQNYDGHVSQQLFQYFFDKNNQLIFLLELFSQNLSNQQIQK